ncbi:hypothetical protein QR680_012947 [Steinernema hermaphroditum]|uniref:Uncharacterized protein n=1 Tax=Steinernema hermaphroditum TaxID=289476 RepID=A0AA39I5A2_9BILA|nr:hypothetical protein QR680_012947 [Steinernema hermaphroditum]
MGCSGSTVATRLDPHTPLCLVVDHLKASWDGRVVEMEVIEQSLLPTSNKPNGDAPFSSIEVDLDESLQTAMEYLSGYQNITPVGCTYSEDAATPQESQYAWDDHYELRFGFKPKDDRPKSEYVLTPEEIVQKTESETSVEVHEDDDSPLYTYNRDKLFNLLHNYNEYSRLSRE